MKPASVSGPTSVSGYALAGLAILVLSIAAAIAPAGAGAASIDPELNVSQPTGWQWLEGLSRKQINAVRAQGWRLIDLEIEGHKPPRFTGVFVHNSGPYARAGNWGYKLSRDQLIEATRDTGRRPIDLEPYAAGGKWRFAVVTVRNKGPAAKAWWMSTGLTPEGVNADVRKHQVRPIDLDTYVVNGERRYGYVGIKNKGVDARSWWWYDNVTPEFVQEKAKEHGARLVDIERVGEGRLTVVMVRNTEGVFSLHTHDLARWQLSRMVASNGVRITDIEHYGDRWAAVMIDNVDSETGRLRSIFHSSPYASGFFGVFAKQVGGPVRVGLAHEKDYQPMSVMKLIPHLYVMDRFDRDEVNLDTDTIARDSPVGHTDRVWCREQDGAKETFHSSLRETLRLSLGQSLNPAHQALVNTYGGLSIRAKAHALGLERTQLFSGCWTGVQDWRNNSSTLADMGELFEGVDEGRFFPRKGWTAQKTFYDLVPDWPLDAFRPVVEQEAGKVGKAAVAHDFLTSMILNGKGGSFEIPPPVKDGHWTTWRAFSYDLQLPIKQLTTLRDGSVGTVIAPWPQVGGFFVNEMTGVCDEHDANTNPGAAGAIAGCLDYARRMHETFTTLPAESQRTAIREALETW